MPTNLYGPNDNFNLETSHVLPALIRKIHLGKCLENNDWEAIRSDLNHRPVEEVNGTSQESEIIEKLSKFGIVQSSTTSGASSSPCNVSVEIWGSGAPMREFLWSEEMAEACVFVVEKVDFRDVISQRDDILTEIRNTHINIGTGKEVSIKQLAELVKAITGFSGELIFNTSKPDGTLRKLTDPSKIHQLGWHHSIEIDEGIHRLYRWYIDKRN
jgi:GDP-L-fucose synthase